ncbi:uncharacterized protein N7446_002282 [Penicillium canescens]|uniref:Uncharacterized protein n=1 Tax=Penicillium canescens TaxID=5083 RepID=A0AAD6IDT7_PENCN|nr:uncharacterized protein N7446_002282 [Penicillium canescens]KAJ6044085.1 hypothetical protein N7460_005440 [Penicillium canescens]KAJ6055556.1 hypothetical protein N7444_004654 [Penicillium canescens]KAJ6074505.1 hypothetical protein N7446_002282 [Penicillium canescens]
MMRNIPKAHVKVQDVKLWLQMWYLKAGCGAGESSGAGWSPNATAVALVNESAMPRDWMNVDAPASPPYDRRLYIRVARSFEVRLKESLQTKG